MHKQQDEMLQTQMLHTQEDEQAAVHITKVLNDQVLKEQTASDALIIKVEEIAKQYNSIDKMSECATSTPTQRHLQFPLTATPRFVFREERLEYDVAQERKMQVAIA